MTRNGPAALVFHALFVIFILGPILIVCAVAFTPLGYLSLPTQGLSLRWFRAIGNNPEFVDAFWSSLWLGALSATIAIAFTVPCALAVARYRFPGREAIVTFLQSPLMIPPAVLGIAFLRFFTEIGLGGTFLGLVLSHAIIVMPFSLRLVIAASSGIDPQLEHAAISLGASWWRAFARVTLPLILPGVASGWVLAFITSFDEVTMTVFIASPRTTTLPVRLFLYIQDNIDPLVAAVSAALIGLTFVAMLLLDRLYGLERLLVGRGRSSSE
jgi:putative spermidine/putrescine transport system permease protein